MERLMRTFRVKLDNGTYTSVQALDLQNAQHKAELKFGSSALLVFENNDEEESMKSSNTPHKE